MIKKLLVTAGLLANAFCMNAQTTKISFEIIEGFSLGKLNGQHGWSNWGYVDDNHSNVVNTIFTDGTNAVEVTANDDEQENWGGIFYDAPQYTKMSISADVYLDSKYASDYDMLTLYSMDVEDYERLGGFYYNFDSGVEVGDYDNYINKSWEANRWYNLKVEINFSTKKIDYYIDNVKITTTTFNNQINSIKEFDFEFDNYESGFKVDNVIIQDLSNMAVEDISKSNIMVYPNPVKEVLYIDAKKDIQSYIISDVLGRTIKHGNNKAIDLRNLDSGIYFITIQTEGEIIQKKIIKN